MIKKNFFYDKIRTIIAFFTKKRYIFAKSYETFILSNNKD